MGFQSIVILIITFSYATKTAIELYHRDNPIIYENYIYDYFGHENGLDLNEHNVKFAFTVQGMDGQVKNDPRFVNLRVFLSGQELKYHKCTDEDWAEFYSPSQASTR